MKIVKYTLLTLALVCWLMPSASAQYYKRKLDVCELLYEEGDYKKALEYVDNLLRKLEKKPDEAEAIPRVLLRKAKYQEALGLYDGFQESVVKALEMRKEGGNTDLAYGVALLDASYLYLIYSDIVTAEAYLNSAENILANRVSVGVDGGNQQKDLYFDSQRLYIRTMINYLRGYYNDAMQTLPELQKIRDQRISTREVFYDDVTGKFDSRRIGQDQVRKRKREYVQVLTLEGQIARDRGKYLLADSLFQKADTWIGQKFRKTKTDLATVRNTHEWILLRIERGDEQREIRKDLENNLFRAERSVQLIHKDYIRAHELILDFYAITNYPRKGKGEDWELENNTRLYFSMEKLPYTLYQRIRAKRLSLGQVKGLFKTRDGQLENAKKSLEELIQQDSSQKLPKNHIEYIRTLEQLYDLAMAQGELDDAKKYLDELVMSNKRIFGEESLPYHLSKIKEADYYLRYTNNFELADDIFKESFEEVLSKRLEHNSFKYINALDEYAEFKKVQGKYEESRDLVAEGVKLAAENVGGTHPLFATELEKLIELELELGEYQVASANIDSVLNIYKDNNGKHFPFAGGYSKALTTSARYYATLGLFSEAKTSLNRSNRLSRRSFTTAGASSDDEKIYLLIRTEKLRQAELLLEGLIERRTQIYGEESRFLISPYNQIAMIALTNGDYLKAQEFSEKAYEMAEKAYGDSSFKITESLDIRAKSSRALGNYDKAEDDIRQILTINKRIFGENHIQLASPYTELALTKLFEGEENLDEASQLVEQSVNIISATLGTDNPVYAEALKTSALVNTELGNYDKAERYLEIASDIWSRKLGSVRNTNSAEIQLILGDVKLRKKEYEAAKTEYTEARRIYKGLFNKQHPDYISAVARLGRVEFTMGNLNKSIKYTEEALSNHKEVIQKYFRAMSDAEKSKFWSSIRTDYEFYNTLAVAASKKKKEMLGRMYDNTIATKALLLSSSIKVRNTILQSKNDSLIANYENWEEKKEQLIEVLGMSNEQLKEEGIDVKQLVKEIERLEKALTSQSNLFGENTEEDIITWKDVKSVLQPNESAAEIIRYRHFTDHFTDSIVYAALVVTPKTSGAPTIIGLPNGNNLEGKFMKYYRTCIEYKIEDKFSYENYWRPIDQVIPEGSKIYLSGEGAYNQINLEAVLNDNGEYVLDRSNIALVSNTKEIVSERRKQLKGEVSKESGKTVLLGNPTFYKNLADDELNELNDRAVTQLPGTQAEVIAINTTLLSNDIGTDIYINRKATETVVKDLASPKVLHVATHGYFLPDENAETDSDLAKEKATNNSLLRSGILLVNAGDLMASNNVYEFNREEGVLTAYEAMQLRLDDTELVVLSACETARGDVKVGDGVYGLQRAFLVAGADAIIMSLFKVDDEATEKLMKYFYQNWEVKGMDKRQAFIEAKRTLRKEFKDPIYWGAFIMIGSI